MVTYNCSKLMAVQNSKNHSNPMFESIAIDTVLLVRTRKMNNHTLKASTEQYGKSV